MTVFFHKGFEYKMLVAVTKGQNLVKLLTHVEGLTAGGLLNFNLTLTELANSKHHFISTEPFNPPKSIFHLAVSEIYVL